MASASLIKLSRPIVPNRHSIFSNVFNRSSAGVTECVRGLDRRNLVEEPFRIYLAGTVIESSKVPVRVQESEARSQPPDGYQMEAVLSNLPVASTYLHSKPQSALM